MRENQLQGLSPGGFHRLAYTEWGDAANSRVVVCAHGLTRNGRDFDALAQALLPEYRAFCPDAVGRGRSDWLADKTAYNYTQYLADSNALIARTGAASLDWVGTSMGGILGMFLAAMPNSPIRRLVINDVGSLVPKSSLERIGKYVGLDPSFDTAEALIDAVKFVSPFGPHSEAEWRHLALSGAKQTADGKWRLRYDPGIAAVFREAVAADIDLSATWKAIRCPVLVTRGAESDLLLRETFDAMCAKPGVRGIQFEGVGHAPTFMHPDQIRPVREFLLAD